MNRDQKAAVIGEIAGEIQEADAVFAIDYRGISVPQAAALRGRLREANASFRVVKNSLTERAADQAGAEALKALLEGPTALAFVRGDAAQAAKALSDAARATQVLDFKGGLLGGSTLTADDIRAIARLPARDVLYAQLVGTVASPLTGLVRGLNALIAGLAIQLQAIADQGLVSGTAPAEIQDAPAAETTDAAEAPDAAGATEAAETTETPDVAEAPEAAETAEAAEAAEAQAQLAADTEGEPEPLLTDQGAAPGDAGSVPEAPAEAEVPVEAEPDPETAQDKE